MTDFLRYESELADDFIGKLAGFDGGWTNTSSGTGAAAALLTTPIAGHPGIVECTAGTTNSGYGALLNSATDFYVDGSSYYMEALVYLPVLSTSGEAYKFWCGFGDTASTFDQVDGITFHYDLAGDGANFIAQTASNSTRTEVDTGFAVAAATWYRLAIAMNGSKAFFYINDEAVATISTNLPSTSSRVFGRVFGILKSNGTTARVADVDYFYTKIVPATNR